MARLSMQVQTQTQEKRRKEIEALIEETDQILARYKELVALPTEQYKTPEVLSELANLRARMLEDGKRLLNI